MVDSTLNSTAEFRALQAKRTAEYQAMFDSFVYERKLDLDDDFWSDEDKELWNALVVIFNARWAERLDSSA